MGALGNVKTVLTAAVADDATTTVSYPAGTDQAGLTGSTGGSVAINGNDVWPQADDGGVEFTFGGSTITIKNESGVSWPAGATLVASFGETSIDGSYNLTHPKQVQDSVGPTGAAIVDLDERVTILENA